MFSNRLTLGLKDYSIVSSEALNLNNNLNPINLLKLPQDPKINTETKGNLDTKRYIELKAKNRDLSTNTSINTLNKHLTNNNILLNIKLLTNKYLPLQKPVGSISSSST